MKHILALIALLAVCSPAWAQEIKILTAQEVVSTIAGRTIVGTMNGVPFRQFFSLNGDVVFKMGTRDAEMAAWRVLPSGDVCTKWDNAVIFCYKIQSTPEGLMWIGPLDEQGQSSVISSLTQIEDGNSTGVPYENGQSKTKVPLDPVAKTLSGWLESF